jgi:hypothetical protein
MNRQFSVVQLLKKYFDIAFLMGKPQDLPAGQNQLQIAIVLNFVTYVLALLRFDSVGKASLHAAIDIACIAALFYVGLSVTKQLARFNQAFGAICGANAILNLVGLLLFSLTFDKDVATSPQMAQLIFFVLMVWTLSLLAHVLRHTFNLRLFNSVMAALVYYLFILQLLSFISPTEFEPAASNSMDSISTDALVVPDMDLVQIVSSS